MIRSDSDPPLLSAREHSSFRGLKELEAFLEEGYGVYLVAGIAGAGKTELLASFQRDAHLAMFSRSRGQVLPTPLRTVRSHPVASAGRKLLFLDASGEDFRALYPPLLQYGDLTEGNLDLLRVVVPGLRGVIWLLDLERLWGADSRSEPYAEKQVEILSWLLMLLRWLRFDDYQKPEAVSFATHIDASVRRMRRRLSFPVLILFSKADRLSAVTTPTFQRSPFRGTYLPPEPRYLAPVAESPLLLCWHLLPSLFRALTAHVNHFRLDFAHSLVTDRETGAVVDPEPCGVQASIAWLLSPSWRWPRIPTRYLLELRRMVESSLLRKDRWRTLPNPEESRE